MTIILIKREVISLHLLEPALVEPYFQNLSVEDPIEVGDDMGKMAAKSGMVGMVRGGFETGKFRLSLDYNFLPVSDIVDVSNNVIGESKNSYLGISLGFFVGGVRWRNSSFRLKNQNRIGLEGPMRFFMLS